LWPYLYLLRRASQDRCAKRHQMLCPLQQLISGVQTPNGRGRQQTQGGGRSAAAHYSPKVCIIH
jgi:hypothetical protein